MEEVTQDVTRMEGFFRNLTESGMLVDIGIIVLKLGLMVVVGLIVIKLILRITRRALDKSSADPVLYTFVTNGVKVLALLILITMCLGLLGISMTTIIAVIGAAGAAIALALKDSLANIAGGVMIIITKPFNKDDLIDVGEVSGKVEAIDLFLTTLKTYDNKTITIPNGLINTSVLVNHSMEDNRRVDCVFGIGYDNDISQVKEILSTVCEADPRIFREPAPLIGVANHGDSAIIMDLKAWCHTEDYWDVKYYLEEHVKLAFDQNDIQIPYPQVDVHLKQ